MDDRETMEAIRDVPAETDETALAMRRIDDLWSVHEIRNLALKYAFAVDSRDWTLLESLWLEPAVRSEPPLIDLHLVRQFAERFPAAGASMLFVGNHLVEIDGDTAYGVVYCFPQVRREVGLVDQAVIYRDVYGRVDDTWYFVTREHLLCWGQIRPDDPYAQTPANWPESSVGSGVAFEAIRVDHHTPTTTPTPSNEANESVSTLATTEGTVT